MLLTVRSALADTVDRLISLREMGAPEAEALAVVRSEGIAATVVFDAGTDLGFAEEVVEAFLVATATA